MGHDVDHHDASADLRGRETLLVHAGDGVRPVDLPEGQGQGGDGYRRIDVHRPGIPSASARAEVLHAVHRADSNVAAKHERKARELVRSEADAGTARVVGVPHVGLEESMGAAWVLVPLVRHLVETKRVDSERRALYILPYSVPCPP